MVYSKIFRPRREGARDGGGGSAAAAAAPAEPPPAPVVVLTLNVCCFRGKGFLVESMIEQLESLRSLRVGILCLTETWLRATSRVPHVSGFYVAARRDREAGRRGGGVLVLVREDLAAVELPAGNGAELAAVELSGFSPPLRVACAYRPPTASAALFFAAVDRFVADAADAGAMAVAAGDFNVRNFDGAPQRGSVVERAPRVGSDAGERREFRELLRARDCSVLSGARRDCPTLRHAVTNLHHARAGAAHGVVASELDFVVGCARAVSTATRGGTENGADGASPWVWSSHRPVWVLLALATARDADSSSSLPFVEPLPRARWGTQTEEELEALRKHLVASTAPITAELWRGLDAWGGRIELAVNDVAACLVQAETRTIGRPGLAQGAGLPPRWWTPSVAEAAEAFNDGATLLGAVAGEATGRLGLADGSVISVAEAAASASAWRVEYKAREKAAHADWLQQRARRAARESDDPRATQASHDDIRETVGAPPKGGDGAHEWATRGIRDVAGGLSYGDGAARVLSGGITRSHARDLDEPRFSRAAAVERDAAFAKLMCSTLPAECVLGDAQRAMMDEANGGPRSGEAVARRAPVGRHLAVVDHDMAAKCSQPCRPCG